MVWGVLLGLMLISKIIKLLGHFIRYPVDFVFLPLSILFGYFHGLVIKPYAMMTLDVVSESVKHYNRVRLLRVPSTLSAHVT